MNYKLPSLTNSTINHNKQQSIDTIPTNILLQTQLMSSYASSDQSITNRRKIYRDISYLKKSNAHHANTVSLIANDPKMYETQYTQNKTNLYASMHKLSNRQELKKEVPKLNQKIINTKGLVEENQIKELHKYIQEITIHTERSPLTLSNYVPPNRQQAIDLQKWFNTMVQNLHNDQKSSSQQLTEKLQLIYSTTIMEIIRQISIECKDRGQLLKNVWDSYISLLDLLVKNYQQKHILVEQSPINENTHQNETMLKFTDPDIDYSTIQNERSQLIEKNNVLSKKLLEMSSEMQQLYTTIDELNEKLEKSQYLVTTQQNKPNQQPIFKAQEGKSLVSHLMNFNNLQFVKSTRIQQIQQDEEYFKTGITTAELENMLNETTPMRFTNQNKQNQEFQRNINLDERDTQTDPMIYSEIPVVDKFIKQLMNKDFLEELNKSDSSYDQSIKALSSCQSIDIDKRDSIIEVLQSAKVQKHYLGHLNRSFTTMQAERQELQKKSVQQMLEIKEHQANSKYLDDVLEEATQQFLTLLKQKNVKIQKLKQSRSNLLIKLNSLNSDIVLSAQSKPNSKSKTPSFQNTFNFQKEDLIIPSSEDPTPSKNDSPLEEQGEASGELILEENESQEDEYFDPDASPQMELNNSNNDASPAIKINKIKSLVQKFGLVRKNSGKKTINLQLIQKLKEQKKVKRVYSQNQEAATSLLNDVLNKKSKKTKDTIIPISSINKIIHTIIAEAAKNPEGFKIPMHVSIYDFFLKKYGFKNVAEKKIKQLLQFIYNKRNQYPKLALLSRLCYMDGQMDEAAYKMVLESQKYFQNKDITFNRLEVLLTSEEIQDYSINFLTQWLGSSYVQFFLNSVKMFQTKTISFESTMIQIINLYFSKKQDCELDLKLIFQAADLDGNNLIEFSEFKTLYQAIHPQIYEKQLVLQQFLEYADYIEEITKDKMMTLTRFAEAAIELKIFQKELLKTYSLGFENLIAEWEANQDSIKYRFLQSEKFHQVKHAYNYLNTQVIKLRSHQDVANDLETLWICYRLMLEKSKKVILNYETKSCIDELFPKEFTIIQKTIKQIEEIAF